MRVPDFLADLYVQRPDDSDADAFRAAWRGAYRPPAGFRHGEWMEIARLSRKPLDGDGTAVIVEECRMPARFYRVAVTNNDGEPAFYLGTGSSQEALVIQIVEALTTGMLTVEAVSDEARS